MTNEKLIEKARRAKAAVYLATDASVADDLSRIIGGLADALEAAEQAHTPTDDEREAMARAVHAAIPGTGPWDDDAAERTGAFFQIGDCILAAGFRRTEVPSDDAWLAGERSVADAAHYAANPEPSAPMSLADDPMRKPFLKKRVYPQGEPSDAQLRTLADTFDIDDESGPGTPLDIFIAGYRAALRAAWEVR